MISISRQQLQLSNTDIMLLDTVTQFVTIYNFVMYSCVSAIGYVDVCVQNLLVTFDYVVKGLVDMVYNILLLIKFVTVVFGELQHSLLFGCFHRRDISDRLHLCSIQCRRPVLMMLSGCLLSKLMTDLYCKPLSLFFQIW